MPIDIYGEKTWEKPSVFLNLPMNMKFAHETTDMKWNIKNYVFHCIQDTSKHNEVEKVKLGDFREWLREAFWSDVLPLLSHAPYTTFRNSLMQWHSL